MSNQVYKEKIDAFVDRLLEKTINNELQWEAAEDVICFHSHRDQPFATLDGYVHNMYTHLYYEDSFCLRNKDEQYLFLIHINQESQIDGSVAEVWSMFAIVGPGEDTLIQIPDYHPNGKEDRIKKISDAIKKNNAAKKETEEKRLLDFLDSFI